jgi:hypothetical protein
MGPFFYGPPFPKRTCNALFIRVFSNSPLQNISASLSFYIFFSPSFFIHNLWHFLSLLRPLYTQIFNVNTRQEKIENKKKKGEKAKLKESFCFMKCGTCPGGGNNPPSLAMRRWRKGGTPDNSERTVGEKVWQILRLGRWLSTGRSQRFEVGGQLTR